MNLTNRAPYLALAFAGLAAVAYTERAHAQNFILNGGFEEPNLGTEAGLFLGTPAGWSGGYALITGNAGYPAIYPEPFAGHQYAEFSQEPGYELWQTVTISTAGLYRLNWQEGSVSYVRPDLGTSFSAPYTVAVTSQNLGTIAIGTFEAGNAGVWEPQALSFELQPGDYTVTFDLNGNFALLDNVSLTAVPEPRTYTTVCGLVLLGFAAFMHRRKRCQDSGIHSGVKGHAPLIREA